MFSKTSREHITERDGIGQTAYQNLVHSCVSAISLRSNEKVNPKMLRDNDKKSKYKLEKSVVEVNEERSLLTRFLLILKAMPEIMDTAKQ